MTIPTFEERVEYLSCKSSIGVITFGAARYLNQSLYTSKEWRDFRDKIIVRDNSCDLACKDHELLGWYDESSKKTVNVNGITVHHINPITLDDIENHPERIFDPENVITTCDRTHKAIHYGSEVPETRFVERKPNDTIPWR